MIFRFNNYFVELLKDPIGQYNIKIIKITGPARFDRELIVKSKVASIESLNEYISRYVPQSNMPLEKV